MTTLDALNITQPPEWMTAGLCAQVDPELFYPERGGSTTAAKQVCTGCPVLAECLAYALANDERFGVWGGTSERERRRIKHHATRTEATGPGLLGEGDAA